MIFIKAIKNPEPKNRMKRRQDFLCLLQHQNGVVSMNKFLICTMIALMLVPVSFAASPVFFRGYAFLDGSTAANGTVVEVFINNASTSSAGVSIGQGVLADVTPQGRYVISFEASTGDNITFKINSAALVAANGTNTSAQQITAGMFVVENFNLSANSSANGVACTYASGCSGGYCVHNICRAASTNCGDGYCDTGESCSTDNSACSASQSCTNGCQTTATTTTSSSGSGGGGAVSLPSTTASAGSIASGETKSVAITEASLPVTTIELTASQSVSAVSVTVKESSAPSTANIVISSSSGSVYKYMEITQTAPSTSISNAKIKFKVPKSWLDLNKIGASTVALNRLAGTTWSKLPTTKLSEDTLNVYYEAETPGFSTFAVTGLKTIGFLDIISKIDDYYKNKVSFLSVIDFIDLYYKNK
ncbi:PGF-pre-PGF domain-containing protein [archaeon]|nr:PGF-pre-PGF domain-containing protein [archaeon]